MWRRVCSAVGTSAAAAMYYNYTESQCAAGEKDLDSAADSPLFRFGLIADVQYADIDAAQNFSRTETRNYRETLQHLKDAVSLWNSIGVNFAVSLGDLIDGQNSGTYGQGLSFKEPQTDTAFGRVWNLLQQCRSAVFHAIGNHELYNFRPSELRAQFNEDGGAQVISGGNVPAVMQMADPMHTRDEFYFYFRPSPGWTFVMLNPYEVSIMQDKHAEGYKQAVRLLNEHNPNDVVNQTQINFFKGLKGPGMRWVPFNGGLGDQQTQWLRHTLHEAKQRGDRVVIFSHIPVNVEAAHFTCITYDYVQIRRMITEAGCVVAFIAGHFHTGGYAVDPSGIHHITLQSPLTHGKSYGYVDVFEDRLELVGVGALPSRTIALPTRHDPDTAERARL